MYLNLVCDMQTNKTEMNRVRIGIGGNLIYYPLPTNTPTTDITTVKTHWNSVLHHQDAIYVCFNVKDFYICSMLPSPEYAKIHTKMIPTESIEYYNLDPLIHNNWLYIQLEKARYSLLQLGQIKHKNLKAHFKPFSYKPTIIPGLWKHKIQPITFTLVVDDFGIKY